MTDALGPTVRRKQLGTALRKLRTDANLRMEDAAEALDCARSRISHIELGRNAVRKPDLKVLLDLYAAPRDAYVTLEELRLAGGKPGWWSTYKLPDWLQAYIGLESDAVTVRSFALELVPGLLQTEDYARQSHQGFDMRGEDVERRVKARIQRQGRIEEGSLSLSVVMSEALLWRTVHGGAVGISQLAHLEAAAKWPNVTLQVLPFAAGSHQSRAGSFSLLTFATGVSLDAAYQEYAIGGHLVDDQDVVQQLSHLYDNLRDQALGVSESLIMVSEIATQTGK